MILRIEQLEVVYGDHAHGIQALEQVTLEIPGGTCLALVGESGSGKTTLGKACMGLLPASARQGGRVLLDGDVVDPAHEAALNRIRRQRIAMVFQDGAAALNPSHRIIDQVAEPLIQLANVNGKAGPESFSEENAEDHSGCPFVFGCGHGRPICREQIPSPRLEDHTQVACHFPL